MEQARLGIRWNLLRVFSATIAVATFLLIFVAIPTRWLIVTSPLFILGLIATTLTVIQSKIAWSRLTTAVQGLLLAVALLSTTFGINDEAYAPLLLLAFTMTIASDHFLSTTLNYSGQFSQPGSSTVSEFNAPAISASLGDLYRRFARDGLVFGVAFLLSIGVAAMGGMGAAVTVLSDPSLYVILLTISLAFLLVLKEEQ